MTNPIRVTFLLPRRYDVALRKLRQSDPSIRTRTDALVRLIGEGLRSLSARTATPPTRKP